MKKLIIILCMSLGLTSLCKAQGIYDSIGIYNSISIYDNVNGVQNITPSYSIEPLYNGFQIFMKGLILLF